MASNELTAVVPQTDQAREYPPDRFTCAYRAIASWSIVATNIFFGEIDVVGLENIPDTGPVILVGNHKNQFVDGMMVNSVVRSRKVSFVIAEASMHRRFIGDAARVMEGIPVIRPQDRARHSPGVITGFDAEGLRLLGSGDCLFTSNLKKGEMIVPHGVHGIAPLVVQEIISDTSVLIKSPIKADDQRDAGQPASLKIPEQGVKFKVIPKIDQSEVFKKVHDALCEGRCIGMFPEGGSSDRTDLLPLKAGVAVMALGAAARGAPVKLVPFGINYSEGSQWRSKVFVDIGKPMTIDDATVERYRSGERREVQAELLKQIEVALRAVTFNAPDKHTQNILRTMRRLYQGPIKLPAKRFMELNRRFAMAFGSFKDDDRFLDLVARVHDYMLKVQALGVRDRQVAALPPLGSVWRAAVGIVALNCIFFFCGFIFITVFPGLVIFAPMLLRIRYVASKEAKRALAGSSVKVKGADVEASQKIISGMIWGPITVLVYVGITTGLMVGLWPRDSPYPPGSALDWFFTNAIWLIPIGSFFACSFLGIYNIYVLDYGLRWFNWLPYYGLIASSACSRDSPGKHIRDRRKELTLRVQEFFDKIVAPTFPEWKDDVIISRELLLNKRRKSDYLRAIQVTEEIEELARAAQMPDSPTLPSSRKTIKELKSSMMRMQEDAARFEAARSNGGSSSKAARQHSFGMMPDVESAAEDKV